MNGEYKNEEWRAVPGYEGRYEISNHGNVKSLFFKRIAYVSCFTKPNDYKCVTLYKNGKRQNLYIHRLVAQAFIPNPNNFSQVNHIDENKSNNCVNNLEWCTAKYNINYGTGIKRRNASYGYQNRKFDKEKMSKRREKPILQISLNGCFIKKWDSATRFLQSIGRKYNSAIGRCCKGKSLTAYGYKWQYAERC